MSDVGEETGRREWKMSEEEKEEEEEEEERYSSQGASRSYTVQLDCNIFNTAEESVLATQILVFRPSDFIYWKHLCLVQIAGWRWFTIQYIWQCIYPITDRKFLN